VASLDDDALDALAQLLALRMAAAQPLTPAGYLAPAEASAYLGLSKKRLYDLKSSRTLEPDGDDGRTPLFTRQALDAYVAGELTRR